MAQATRARGTNRTPRRALGAQKQPAREGTRMRAWKRLRLDIQLRVPRDRRTRPERLARAGNAGLRRGAREPPGQRDRHRQRDRRHRLRRTRAATSATSEPRRFVRTFLQRARKRSYRSNESKWELIEFNAYVILIQYHLSNPKPGHTTGGAVRGGAGHGGGAGRADRG